MIKTFWNSIPAQIPVSLLLDAVILNNLREFMKMGRVTIIKSEPKRKGSKPGPGVCNVPRDIW
jgi:hypothetical protein